MKTAVEQFKQEFFSYAEPYSYFSEDEKWVITLEDFEHLITKFKAMEKQQIIRTHLISRCYDNENSVAEAEQYYNETFKSE